LFPLALVYIKTVQRGNGSRAYHNSFKYLGGKRCKR
jgi:hypothetical protein